MEIKELSKLAKQKKLRNAGGIKIFDDYIIVKGKKIYRTKGE